MQNYIIAARTAQGYEEYTISTKEERTAIIEGWYAAQPDLARAKLNFADEARHRAAEFKAHRPLSVDERKKMSRAKSEKRKSFCSHKNKTPDPVIEAAEVGGDEAQFDEAIKVSVAATSRGEPEEDKLIEKAIRASVLELLAARRAEAQQQKSKEAIRDTSGDKQSSAPVMTEVQGDDVTKPHQLGGEGGNASDQTLESSQQRSTQHDGTPRIPTALDSPSDETDTGHDEEEMQRALEESRLAHIAREDEEERERKEEEIVLAYVKKQSLAEERHKREAGGR